MRGRFIEAQEEKNDLYEEPNRDFTLNVEIIIEKGYKHLKFPILDYYIQMLDVKVQILANQLNHLYESRLFQRHPPPELFVQNN